MKKANIIKTTLDSKHNEISNSFKQNEEVIIPKYLKIIEKLESLLQNSNNSLKNQTLIENIKKYKNLIHSLERKKNEYYFSSIPLRHLWFGKNSPYYLEGKQINN